jgi:hypothetical protein
MANKAPSPYKDNVDIQEIAEIRITLPRGDMTLTERIAYVAGRIRKAEMKMKKQKGHVRLTEKRPKVNAPTFIYDSYLITQAQFEEDRLGLDPSSKEFKELTKGGEV